MEIKNIQFTEFNQDSCLPTTSVDQVKNKESCFALDTELLAIQNALIELHKILPYDVQYDNLWDDNDWSGMHNSTFRGRKIGTTVTAKQFDCIDDGSFFDMWIGDYWNINSVKWRIAAFDYFLGCGDTPNTKHHVVIVPDTSLAFTGLNATNHATGAYVGSDFYTGNNGNTAKSQILEKIYAAFGESNILSHREMLANAIDTNGLEQSQSWYDCKVELMNEHMVMGKHYEPAADSTLIPQIKTANKCQLPLFAISHKFITSNQNYWLRNVAKAPQFVAVTRNGNAHTFGAYNSNGFRPYFCLYKGA